MNSDNQTPKILLSKFYEENNLGDDGGVTSSYVRVELSKKIILYFPNFKARRRAVLKHDIHHLVTGYSTSIQGEAEISAWEIASRCKSYWAAFVLDTSGILIGLWLNPVKMLRAFARGRKTRNLYDDHLSDEKAVNMTIADLRKQLKLDQFPIESKIGLTDILLLVTFLLFGLIFSILSLALMPFILIYSLYIYFNRVDHE